MNNRIPTNWSDRIEILTLRNQGWTNAQIARKLGKHPASTLRMYERIKGKSVQELEEARKLEENSLL